MDTATTVAVVGLVITVLAATVGFIVFALQSQQGRVNEALRIAAENSNQATFDRLQALEMCQSLHRLCNCLASDQKVLRDLIEQELANRAEVQMISVMRRAWRESDSEIEGHQADVRIFSPLSQERESAFRVLASRLGDIDSLRKMQQVARDDRMLQSFCSQLEARLRRDRAYR